MPRPLTPAEELDLVLLLGYPADYQNENPFFFGALQRINGADHLYDKAIEFLTRAAAIKTKIADAAGSAGIHSLDKADVVFFGAGNAQYDALNAQLRGVIKELSTFCAVEILNDITTGAGPLNTRFFGALPGNSGAFQW